MKKNIPAPNVKMITSSRTEDSFAWMYVHISFYAQMWHTSELDCIHRFSAKTIGVLPFAEYRQLDRDEYDLQGLLHLLPRN